jgi:hypothetical protein
VSTNKYYRLRVRNAGDTADDFIISSYAGVGSNLVLEPPNGDGQKMDPLTGNVDVGTYTIKVIDTGTAPANAVTSRLYDSNGRFQLLNRRAYTEVSADGSVWNVLSAGYVTKVGMPDPGQFSFAMGDTRRVEQTYDLFRSIAKRNVDGSETILRLNRATSFIGGPVEGGFGPMRDHGGWRMRVEEKYSGINIVRLRFEWGWYPTNTGYRSAQGYAAMHSGEGLRIAGSTYPYAVHDGTYWNQLQVDVAYPRLRVKILDESGALLGWRPVYGSRGPSGTAVFDRGDILVDWAAAPAVGTKVYCYMYALDISEWNPLHLNGHPADLIGDMWADVGIPYDPASITAVRNAIGPDLRIGLRYTAPMKLVDVERSIFGPFGIGTRIDSSGRRVMFTSRVKGNAVPSLTVTYASLREDIPELFDIEESGIVNRVIIKSHEFREDYSGTTKFGTDIRLIRDVQIRNYPDYHLDFVTDVPRQVEVEFEDPTSYGTKDVTYEFAGYIYSAAAANALGYLPSVAAYPLDTLARGIAEEVFDRFGRGPLEIPLKFLDGFAGQLGDEFLLNVPHFPNASNTRGGTRVMQVLQRTETVDGPDVVALDSGASAQFSTVPTFSLAGNTLQPRNVADITITNPTSLGTNPRVRFEYGTGATAPSANGVLLGTVNPAYDTVLSTPILDGGTKVWVRARTEGNAQRPSAWSAWTSLTLTAMPVLSGLSVTAIGPTEYDLSWTNPDTTGQYLVDIMSRATATEATRIRDTLPPGSTKYRLTLPDNTTAYDFGPRLRERPPLNGVSATVTSSVTTGTKSALNVPTNPRAFAASAIAATGADGTYGMDVDATVFPSATEFWVAPETSVGSNTPGTYVLAASVPSVSDGKTSFATHAPNDGLRRYMYARHVLQYRDPSAATAVVSVFPWVTTQVSDYPVPVPSNVTGSVVYVISDRGEEARVRVSFTPPSLAHYARMIYLVQSRPAGSTGTFGGDTFVVGSHDGPDLIPANFATEYSITPYTETSGTQTRSAGGAFSVTSAARSDPTPAYGTPIAGSTAITYPGITYDTETKFIEVWSLTATSLPTNASAENVGTMVTKLAKGDGRLSIQLAVDATNQYRRTTFVPYDKDGNRGPVTTFVTQRATPATPNPPASASNTSNPNPATGAITNRVTLGSGTLAGYQIRTYRNGAAYGTDRTLVAGDISAGYVDIVDSGVNPSTAYTYEYTTVNGSGAESTTKTALITVTTFAGTLPTPVITYPVTKSTNYHTINWTDPTAPTGTYYILEQRDNGTGSWTYMGNYSGLSAVVNAQVCPNTREYRVWASKSGWTASGYSAVETGPCV